MLNDSNCCYVRVASMYWLKKDPNLVSWPTYQKNVLSRNKGYRAVTLSRIYLLVKGNIAHNLINIYNSINDLYK